MFLIFVVFSMFLNSTFAVDNVSEEQKKDKMRKMEEARKRVMTMLQQKMKHMDINKIYTNYKKKPVVNPKLDVIKDRVYGKKDAKYKILVFSDFACGHCSKASFNLKARVDENKDKVNLNYAFFPLDKDCNKNLAGKLSDYSCPSVKLALCAEKEGKLNDAIPYLYTKKPDASKKEKTDVDKLIKVMGKDLKLKDLKNCMSSDWLKKRIQEENDIYKGLTIRGTPIVLLNGKELGPIYKSDVLFKQFLNKLDSEENPKRK